MKRCHDIWLLGGRECICVLTLQADVSRSSKSGDRGTKEVYLTPGAPVDIPSQYFVNQSMDEVQRLDGMVEKGSSQGVSQGHSSDDSSCNGRKSEGPNETLCFSSL